MGDFVRAHSFCQHLGFKLLTLIRILLENLGISPPRDLSSLCRQTSRRHCPPSPVRALCMRAGCPHACTSQWVHLGACSEAATYSGLRGHPDRGILKGGCAQGNSPDSLQLPSDGGAFLGAGPPAACVGMERLRPELLRQG